MEAGSVPECFLCKEGVVNDSVNVTRGLENLIRVSKERCDNFHLFLQKQSSVRMHNKCRGRYIIKSRGKFAYNEFDKHSSRRLDHLTSPKRQKKRSHSDFDFKNNCCQLAASIEKEKRKSILVKKRTIVLVSNKEFKTTLLNQNTAHIDIGKYEATLEIISGIDLTVVGAIYHEVCRLVFYQLSEQASGKAKPKGRPKNSDISAQIERIVAYIMETGEEMYTMAELTKIGGIYYY
ncbi:unnamed protein product [Psylliodes chrysocephalus]|uniref:Uncharacterized protein n=1 Tax=Psylliodes chrysocephalus TaxID=3402493 RepID=A0A9P0CUY4_9CUCU|nr:unnamed protein product [Psylliodes chrysocephala]